MAAATPSSSLLNLARTQLVSAVALITGIVFGSWQLTPQALAETILANQKFAAAVIPCALAIIGAWLYYTLHLVLSSRARKNSLEMAGAGRPVCWCKDWGSPMIEGLHAQSQRVFFECPRCKKSRFTDITKFADQDFSPPRAKPLEPVPDPTANLSADENRVLSVLKQIYLSGERSPMEITVKKEASLDNVRSSIVLCDLIERKLITRLLCRSVPELNKVSLTTLGLKCVSKKEFDL